MKTFQLVVVLLVVCISSCESLLQDFEWALALKCNRCSPPPGHPGKCTNTVETCKRPDDICASVIHQVAHRITFFKRCMRKYEAELLKSDPSFTVLICNTDRCN
ncbi:hypothetical protein Q8A73_003993 [Channa argus]|nr:hypothetical protein Q8A73_003993 [Channa argus]